jgi:hypothetical protein
MAEKMKMSDNVAGVTLLALGNGAPGMYWVTFLYSNCHAPCKDIPLTPRNLPTDIFSSLAGIRQGRAELAFGELFGKTRNVNLQRKSINVRWHFRGWHFLHNDHSRKHKFHQTISSNATPFLERLRFLSSCSLLCVLGLLSPIRTPRSCNRLYCSLRFLRFRSNCREAPEFENE